MGLFQTFIKSLGIKRYLVLGAAGAGLSGYKWLQSHLEQSGGVMTLPDIPAWEIFGWFALGYIL